MIILVLGGTRSGKSQVAERLAAELPTPVTYVATGWASDWAMADRIERHRQRRPKSWSTIEIAPDPAHLPQVLSETTGTVLVDALGTWVARLADAPVARADDRNPFAIDPRPLCDALRSRRGHAVLVSEEVGLSVHPPSEAGRWFTDGLGDLNQAVADLANLVLFAAAGRLVPLTDADTVIRQVAAEAAGGSLPLPPDRP